jgi:hypothetical protein
VIKIIQTVIEAINNISAGIKAGTDSISAGIKDATIW